MKIISALTIFGLVASIGSISTTKENVTAQYQTILIPSHTIEFSRGNYKIISQKYNKNSVLSDKELIEVLKIAGFRGDGLKMAWAIAIKESTARPLALNKSSNCYGLFQINMSGSLGLSRREKYKLETNKDLFNPVINATIAYKMSNNGTNWSAWTTKDEAKSIFSQFPE